MNQKLINCLFILGIVLVFLVGIFMMSYFFKFQQNECVKDPFIYGAKQMEDNYGIEFRGYGNLMVETGGQPSFFFNSNDSHWVKSIN